MFEMHLRCRSLRHALFVGVWLALVSVWPGARNSVIAWGEPPRAGASEPEEVPETPRVEVIRERYPDGKLKVEREVTLDADGNYVNHGIWQMLDPAGNLVADGRYEMGRRIGKWMRSWSRGEGPLLQEHPFDKFEAPFVSRATFAEGVLDGEWNIVDARERKCSRIEFHRGKRDGTATLWQVDGRICREATFRNGVAVGDVRERTTGGQLVTIATYLDGHQLVNKVADYSGTKKKRSDESYLLAAVEETSPDDFWQLRFATFTARGEKQRHGTWKSWHSNGQIELEGEYQFDRENGKFTWWHANGQAAVEGQFVDGQEDGKWVWWYASGQKAAEGNYHYGKVVGLWRGWSEDGRLVQRDHHGTGRANGEIQSATVEIPPETGSPTMIR